MDDHWRGRPENGASDVREVLERLAIVRFAKHVGFKVTEVRQLLAGIYGRPLMETLHHKCPHLVERGNAIDQDKQKPTDS